MMNSEILKMFEKLDLSEEPYNEVENLIGNLSQYFALTVPLVRSTVIIRARPNDGDGHFSTKCDLTYPPKSSCKKCGRAAIPNEQMFYACTFENGDIPKSLSVAQFEANFSWDSPNRITFGYWRVKKNLELFAVLPDKNLSNLSPAAKILKVKFLDIIYKIEQVQLKESSIEIANYFSSNFSKKVVSGKEYEYIISAEFSKYLIKNGFDGILYPSVNFSGEVLNIALSPQAADTSLDLEGVREFKFSNNTLYLEAYADLYPGQTHFQLTQYRDIGLKVK